jgi:hypothetical protein
MAYLPTVEFGPGMTSATEIRTAWPTLSAKHKVALVMSLYPTTQRNRKLAATVVKLLDTAMGSEELNEFAVKPEDGPGSDEYEDLLFHLAWEIWSGNESDQAARKLSLLGWKPEYGDDYTAMMLYKIGNDSQHRQYTIDDFEEYGGSDDEQNVAEMDAQNMVGGMTASYQQRENQPVDEDYIDEKWSQKYKSSINCANPRGFSQRAHCAGRKK